VEPESSSLGKGRKRRRGFKLEARTKVVEAKGEVSLTQKLRKRVSSFSTGVAVGGENFVKGMAAQYRKEFDRKKERDPSSVSEGKGSFFVMRE